jgi:WD40 repeat protein
MNPAISEAGKSLRLARNRALAATIVMVAWATGAARAAEEEPKGLTVSKMKDVSMGSAVMQVQFSRDGELLAAACRTGLRLWRLGQDKLPQQLIWAVAGADRCGCLAFSPDGRNVAIGETVSPGADTLGTYTGRVRLLQVGSGKQLWERQTKNPVRTVTFSPDGRTLAVAYNGLAESQLWDPCGGQLLGSLHAGYGQSLTFSHSGKLLAAGTNPPEPHFSPSIAPGGPLVGPPVLPAGADGTVWIWDPATKKTARELCEKSAEGVTSLAFSPDDRLLAAGCEDGKVRLWDVGTGNVLRTIPVHDRPSHALPVAFSPDGKVLACGSYNDDRLHFWDVRTGKPLLSKPVVSGAVMTLCFSPDGGTLATADWNDSDGRVALWKVELIP